MGISVAGVVVDLDRAIWASFGSRAPTNSMLSALVRPKTRSCSLDRQPIERLEVVDPAHRQDVAAAGARQALGDERRRRRLEQQRVGRAVDEAGQVAAVAVDEARLVGRRP